MPAKLVSYDPEQTQEGEMRHGSAQAPAPAYEPSGLTSALKGLAQKGAENTVDFIPTARPGAGKFTIDPNEGSLKTWAKTIGNIPGGVWNLAAGAANIGLTGVAEATGLKPQGSTVGAIVAPIAGIAGGITETGEKAADAYAKQGVGGAIGSLLDTGIKTFGENPVETVATAAGAKDLYGRIKGKGAPAVTPKAQPEVTPINEPSPSVTPVAKPKRTIMDEINRIRSGVGSGLKTAGEKTFQAVIPSSVDEATMLQNQAVKAATGEKVTPVQTVAKSALESKGGGIGFSRTGVGGRSDIAAAKLWKDEVQPMLTKSKQQVSFDTDILPKLFEKVKARAGEDVTRQKAYVDALETVAEDFGGRKYDMQKLQDLKSAVQARTPQKFHKGQEVTGALQDVRGVMGQVLREELHNRLSKEFGKDTAKIYQDWANLKDLAEIGIKGRTEGLGGMMAPGGFGTMVHRVIQSVATPAATGLAKMAYRAGEAITPKVAPKASTVAGEAPAGAITPIAPVEPSPAPSQGITPIAPKQLNYKNPTVTKIGKPKVEEQLPQVTPIAKPSESPVLAQAKGQETNLQSAKESGSVAETNAMPEQMAHIAPLIERRPNPAHKFKSLEEALNDPEMQAKYKAIADRQKAARGYVVKTSRNLYHTTPSVNLESIAEKGLTTGNKARFEGVSGNNNISFSANEEGAKYFAGNNDVMIRTKTSYKPKTLEHDLLAGGEGTYITHDNIPPEFLEVKIGGKWVPVKDAVKTYPKPLPLKEGGKKVAAKNTKKELDFSVKYKSDADRIAHQKEIERGPVKVSYVRKEGEDFKDFAKRTKNFTEGIHNK